MRTTLQNSGRHSLSALIVACGLAFLACLLVPVAHVRAQSELAVTPGFDSQHPVTPDTPIEIHLSRPVGTAAGRVALVINQMDVTSLFIVDGARLVYSPSFVPLPLGQAEVFVYLVGADNSWRELGRFPLNVVKEKPASTPNTVDSALAAMPFVKTNGEGKGEPAPQSPANAATSPTDGPVTGAAPAENSKPTEPAASPKRKFGFDSLSYLPTLTLAIKSQPAQFTFPESIRPIDRATFTDGTLQFSLRSEMARDWFGMKTSFDFAGSTVQSEALRFGTLATRAPQVDLSSYLLEFKLGRARVAVGSTSFGSARHLVSGFSSRGITITIPITRRFDFSVAALNGTNIVGYGNFVGLGRPKHQLQAATIGVELIPKRPGGLRIEVSGIMAYIQALNNFSQGSVTDVERSKGGSVRLIASDKAGRLRFDGGFTRSTYRNPADPLLYQGTNTVAVPFRTRNARYFDVSYDVLRGYALTKKKQVNLSVAMRHEQVDPLYKSLGASAGADRLQNDFQLSGSIGEITIQAGHSRFNDNLRHIASILQSFNRAEQFSIALPAAALWGGTSSTSKYLPRLSYSRSLNHQFANAIPVNGGFESDPSAVPNQYSTSQNFSADWQFQKLNVGYNYNRSFTNNEQRGRERSDFLNQSMSTRVGFNPTPKINLNFDLTRDSASDLEGSRLNRTWRVGPTLSWTINKHLSWTAGFSNTIAGDRAQTSGSRNTEFDTQFSYRTGWQGGELKKMQLQMFIRYADRYARSNDLIFGTSNLTRVQIFNAGLNLTLF